MGMALGWVEANVSNGCRDVIGTGSRKPYWFESSRVHQIYEGVAENGIRIVKEKERLG